MKPTIDEQIEFLKNSRHSILGSDDLIYTAILENLLAIKHWSEKPVCHGTIDLRKVIEKLLHSATMLPTALNDEQLKAYKESIQNAKYAIGMLRALDTPYNSKNPNLYFDVPKVECELIDEKHLLDREWIRLTHRRYRQKDTENYIKLLNAFGTSEKNMMWIYETDQEDGTLYFGKIPNRNQFDLLIDLLEIP